MRSTIAPVILVSIALALLVVQMSGLAGVIGGSPGGDYQVDDRVEDIGNQQPEVTGSAPGQSPDSIQFLVSAGKTIVTFATGVFLLPATFNHWMPWYSAYPLGLGLQMLAIIGVAQYFGGPWR